MASTGKRVRARRTAAIVAVTLLVLLGIAAAAVALYARHAPTAWSHAPKSPGALDAASATSSAAVANPPGDGGTEATRSSTTSGSPSAAPLDAAAARALVDRFLSATKANDDRTANGLIASNALRKYGTENLKVKGIVTGWAIDSVAGAAGKYVVTVTVQAVTGPEQFRFTVGRDAGTPRILDFEVTVSQ